MAISEEILEYQISHGIFETAVSSKEKGIAQYAVDNSFSALTPKQKSVLEPYLKKTCSGVTDPGGNHNECSVVLEGQALLDAYHRSFDSDSLLCEKCEDEQGFHEHHREKFFRD